MTPDRLAALFLEERAKFGPRCATVGLTLKLRKPKRKQDRDQAWTDGKRVYFYVTALDLDEDHIRGLLRHEFGHIVRPEATEAEVDLIAEQTTGEEIRYDDRGIQTIGPGTRPRPATLHKNPEGKRTTLDLMLDKVKRGEREITFDTEGYTEAERNRIIDAAEARGLHASRHRQHILIRAL